MFNYGIKIINEKIELIYESLPFYQKMNTKFEEYKLIIDDLEQKKKNIRMLKINPNLNF